MRPSPSTAAPRSRILGPRVFARRSSDAPKSAAQPALPRCAGLYALSIADARLRRRAAGAAAHRTRAGRGRGQGRRPCRRAEGARRTPRADRLHCRHQHGCAGRRRVCLGPAGGGNRKIHQGIDWEAVVGGKGRRPLEPIEQKRLATEANTALELGLRDGEIVTPYGLANSSAIDDLLRAYVARSRLVADFDKLPIPYRAVATDMITGDMVVLDHGDLANAMRASMAIPGAFSPVVGEGYILSDGGMVRNIPVDVARNTCADIVIVVNLVEPPATAEKLAAGDAAAFTQHGRDVRGQRKDPVAVAHGARHPHRRADGRHRDGRFRPRAGDHSAGRGSCAPGHGSPGCACSGQCGIHGVAATRSTRRQDVEAKVADIRIRGPRPRQPGIPPDNHDHSSRRRCRHQRHQRGRGRMSALRDLESVGYRLEGSADAATLVWLPTGSVDRPECRAAQHGPLCGRRWRPQVPTGCPARP